MCAKFLKSLYGTRDAALNWARAYSSVLEKMGFKKRKSSPCTFFPPEWKVCTVVHGDDFMSEGPAASLEKMDAEMKKSFSLKTEVLGGGPIDVKRVKVLSRQISWNEGKLLWEADPQHVEILADMMGLRDGKPVKTPGEENDNDKTVKYRDLDGDNHEGGSAAADPCGALTVESVGTPACTQCGGTL